MRERLRACRRCDGFLPPKARSCPLCGHRPQGVLASINRAVIGVAGGGLLTATLMACYGAAYGPPPTNPTAAHRCPPSAADQDGDCIVRAKDCNDRDQTVYPGAADPAGDGIDQNCDGADGTNGSQPR